MKLDSSQKEMFLFLKLNLIFAENGRINPHFLEEETWKRVRKQQ